MAEQSFFQSLAGEVVDFFDHLVDLLDNRTTRTALIKDLGGSPDATVAPPAIPSAQLDAIRAYQLAETTTAAQDAALVHDILTLLDAVTANVELLIPAFGGGDQSTVTTAEQLTFSILELAGSNWVRNRYPRLFFLLQAVQVIEDLGSTFGPGNGSYVRIGSAFAGLGTFLFRPGRTLADLPGSTVAGDDWSQWGDLVLRLLTVTFGVLVGIDKIRLDAEIMHGWDAPGLDVDSDTAPTAADIIANTMGSISVRRVSDEPSDQPDTAQQAQISFSMVPADLLGGSAALMIALGGALEVTSPVNPRWTMTLTLRSDAGVAMLIGGPDNFQIVGPNPDALRNLTMRIGAVSVPDATSKVSFAIPRRTGTRLEIGQLSMAFEVGMNGAEVTGSLLNSALVLDSADSDGLVRELLGGVPLRLPFNLTTGVSTSRGFILEGSTAVSESNTAGVQNSPLAGGGSAAKPTINATIPLGRKVGPVTVHEIALRVDQGSADEPGDGAPRIAIAADVSLSAQLGPVYVRLDKLGLGVVFDQTMPRSQRNLRIVDADLSVRAPLGVAVSIDSDFLTGGGLLIHDPVEDSWAGSLVLKLDGGVTLNATGIIASKYPDGSPGTSMIVIGTVEGLSWMVGPLHVDGLGVIIGVNRTVDVEAIRAGLPTGALKNVLFPPDPIHHTTEVVSALRTFFPAKRGNHLIGFLAKLSYLKPAIITINAALIYAWGDRKRLVILGRISSILPEKVGLIRLNLDALGVIDLSAGTVSLDAVLVDSKLCDRFPLTGAAALRGDDTVAGFALAVGGLHPKFPAPPGFPVLPRITLALTTGDNPSLVCQAYLAITANTVQFGANARLYAAACGFSIEGAVGFDVLIQLLPFHYLAEFRASVQLKRGSHNLFKVSVEGALEGPLPLRVKGKATFEILWWDYSVSFDRTLIGGSTPSSVPGLDVLAAVLAAFGDQGSWLAGAPGPQAQLVSVRSDARPGVLLHPAGTLTVRQRIAPLNLTRGIDRMGQATPTGARRFAVTSARLGDDTRPATPVSDLFPPAQFFDMSDDDQLAAPSFERMDSGVTFGTTGYEFDTAFQQASPFDTVDIVIDEHGNPVVEPEPTVLTGDNVFTAVLLGAAAGAATRRTLSARFAVTAGDDAPRLSRRGWAAVTGGAPAGGEPTTWAEARLQAGALGLVVPSVELIGR